MVHEPNVHVGLQSSALPVLHRILGVIRRNENGVTVLKLVPPQIMRVFQLSIFTYVDADLCLQYNL